MEVKQLTDVVNALADRFVSDYKPLEREFYEIGSAQFYWGGDDYVSFENRLFEVTRNRIGMIAVEFKLVESEKELSWNGVTEFVDQLEDRLTTAIESRLAGIKRERAESIKELEAEVAALKESQKKEA